MPCAGTDQTHPAIHAQGADEEAVLTAEIVSLASAYGRYGYRRITALLSADGWRVNHKRVERIWRREGLKVPSKQPKRGRLWLNDGSCIRLRPEYRNHVWAYDFVEEAKVLTEGWRREYNQIRPHSALGYKPPAPEAVSGPLSATAS